MMPSPQVPPDVWAADNRVYPDTAGIPGPRDPHLTPYAIPFGRAVHSGDRRINALVTGAQMGKTDTELDIIGARLDQRPAPIAFVGPTRDFINDQFEPRVMDLLDEAECLREKVVRGRKMKKSLKWISGVPLRLVHGGSSTALKSFPAALALIDEYDEMMGNVRGQGDVLGLVDARGQTYTGYTMAVSSTPGRGYVETEVDPVSGLEFWKQGDIEQIESPIWRLWQEGARYHWAWPCPHCKTYFVPRFKELRWGDPGMSEKDMMNVLPATARRTVHINCRNCGCEITDQDDKDWMNEFGKEVAPGQNIKFRKDGPVVTGEPDNQSETWSLWVSGLCSPFVTWGERIETYLTAVQSGDPDRIQTAKNAQFGELWSAGEGGNRPVWQRIMDRVLPYSKGTDVPRGVLRVVAGVDVQKDGLYYVIVGYGGRGTAWVLDWGFIFGRTDHDLVWETLTDVLTEPLAGGMMIEKVMIDSGFRPDKKEAGGEHRVYEYCRDHSWFATATKGKDVQYPPYRVTQIEINRRGQKRKTSIDLAWLSSDFFKSLVYTKINMPIEQVGGLFVPSDVTEEFARQATSEARTLDEKGKPVWETLAKDNHYLDCLALAEAGAYSLNVHKLPAGIEREIEDDEAPRKNTEAISQQGSPAREDKPVPEEHAGASHDDAGTGTDSLRDRWRNRSRRRK